MAEQDPKDINKDGVVDFKDFEAALQSVSEAKYNQANTWDTENMISRFFKNALGDPQSAIEYATPIGQPKALIETLVGGASEGGGKDVDAAVKQLETIAKEQYGLTPEEIKALIDKADVNAKYSQEQKNASDKIDSLVQRLNVNVAFVKSPKDIFAGTTPDMNKKEQDLKPILDEVNKLGIDVSDVPKDAAYVPNIIKKIETYKSAETGMWNLPTIKQPTDEEQIVLKNGAIVEQKIIDTANAKTSAPVTTLNVTTNADGSKIETKSDGSTTITDTKGNVTSTPANKANEVVSGYNTFLNADDPNAFIGITDASGKVKSLDPITGKTIDATATYRYKDVNDTINNLDEQGRIQLKKYLYAGNMYGASDVVNIASGNITDVDIKALTSAMAGANINGLDYNTYLKPMYEEFLYTGRPAGEKAVDLNGDGKVDSSDANNVVALKSFLKNNGMEADDNYIASYDKAIRSGAVTLAGAQDEIRQKLISPSYEGYADQINKGMDIADIASPYKTKISSMLGIDSSMIDLNDPLMKKMLNNKNAEGKPTYTSMLDAEDIIRQDPRWRSSSKAQTEVAGGMFDLLSRFGII